MVSSTTVSTSTSSSLPPLLIEMDFEAKKKFYKTDTQTLAKWLEVGIVKRKGRAYDADKKLLPIEGALVFPNVQGFTLTEREVSVPDNILFAVSHSTITTTTTSSSSSSSKASTSSQWGEIKLVAFSFKQYGFDLLRSWTAPFMQEFGGGKFSQIPVIEICWIEYSFLSMVRKMFAEELKKKVLLDQHDLTVLTFGNIMEFASALLLPNKYTGYVFLLDKENRVRWRGSGEALPDELPFLFQVQ